MTPARVLTVTAATPVGLSAARLNVTRASRVPLETVVGLEGFTEDVCGYCSTSGIMSIEIGPLVRSLGLPSLPVADVYATFGFQSSALRSIGVSVTSFTVKLSWVPGTLGSSG